MKKQAVGRISADEWEIYSTVWGSANVARRMTSALVDALKGVDAGDEDGARAAYNTWGEWVKRFRGFGALDTEPRAVARENIRRVLGLGDRFEF